MEQLIREWLAAHASPAVLATICGIVLAVTQAVKVILDGLAEDGVCPRITRLTAFPLAWPILAASIGAVSGLALVGLSLTGAAVGVLTAMIASGGFSWLKKSAEIAWGPASLRKSQMLLVFLLVFVTAGAAGCMAPAGVREAQSFEADAWRIYAANVRKIDDLILSLYADARARDIDVTTGRAVDRVAAATTPEEIRSAVLALLEERDNARAATADAVSRIRSLIAANQAAAAKAMRLHGGVAEWLEAGMELSALDSKIAEAVALIQAARSAPNP